MHRFGKRLRIGAVIAGLGRRGDAGRGVERHQAARIGIDDLQARRELQASRLRRALARKIEHEDSRLHLQPGKRPRDVRNPYGVDRNVAVARDAGADGDEIVLALELQTITRKIDGGRRVRPRRRHALQKLAIRGAERVCVEVARARNVEARRLQRIGDQRCVVAGGLVSPAIIGVAANYEGETRFLLRLRRRRERDAEQDRRQYSEPSRHRRFSRSEASP